MRYLKDEWAAKNGGELLDADKWKISDAVDSGPQQKNYFDCGVFACMYVDFIYREHLLSFSQYYITNKQFRKIIVLSIFNGAAIECIPDHSGF